jgi:Ca-activated chloride channel family protein
MFLLIVWIIILAWDFKFIVDKNVIPKKNFDVQIIYDVSLSMVATDFAPSRFQASKQALSRLISNLSWYNVSLIAFSWLPFILVPWTDQTDLLKYKIDKMKLSDFPPTSDFLGTALWDALMLWLKNIGANEKSAENRQIMILITDWDSNKWFDPEQVADLSKKLWVSLIVLWIWESDIVVGKDIFWVPVQTKINYDLLKKIANNSQWLYFKISSVEQLDSIFDSINQMIKSDEFLDVQNKRFNLNLVALPMISVWLLFFVTINLLSLRRGK